MKSSLITFGICTLAISGCYQKPQNSTETTSANSSSEPSLILPESDFPKCDSEETRKIISEVFEKSEKLSPHFKNSFCVMHYEYANQYFYLGTPDSTNNCEALKSMTFNTTWNELLRQHGKSDTSVLAEQLKILKLSKIIFVPEIETQFTSFLVKQEEKAPDGNSNNCIVSFELESSSKVNEFHITEKKPFLSLRIYKANSKGEREYDFSWE